ncbi:MAG: hypothetical protein IJI14_07610 [Anaerolineaceae bacterium]|nr:hypothetical protein [Anaerolineaceae bacterium]
MYNVQRKRLTELFIITAAVVLIGCAVYLPGINRLGIYRDDWNNYYNAVTRGAEFLKEHYAADRPADGILLSGVFKLFETNNTAYLLLNLSFRILGSVLFALSVLSVFGSFYTALAAGTLSVVFPGFLQQVEGISYVPHQTAMFFFMLSLYLSVKAVKSKSNKKSLLTTASCLTAAVSPFLMEYYIGMEIARYVFFYVITADEKKSAGKNFRRALVLYLPWILPAAAFLIWRIFFFNAARTGTDFYSAVILPFIYRPKRHIADIVLRSAKNVWKLFIGVWTIPVNNFVIGMDIKTFLKDALSVIAASVVVLTAAFYGRRGKEEKEDLPGTLTLCGLFSGIISMMPLILTGHDINFYLSLDRFSWAGMIGSILFLTGIFQMVKSVRIKTIILCSFIFLSSLTQIQNKNNYIDQWKNSVDYWQQLIWRAPSIKEGTTIVSSGTLLAEEDYDIFVPANLIYYPEDKDGRTNIGAEVLNSGTIKDIHLGKFETRETRKIITEKDYNSLLVLSKPTSGSCLHVINGENPFYTDNDDYKITQIGTYSKLDRIDTSSGSDAVYPFFIEENSAPGWCYYYEKIELALQKGDFEKASLLADTAAEMSLEPVEITEYIPVIRAYAHTGQKEKELETASKLLDAADDHTKAKIYDYFALR